MLSVIGFVPAVAEGEARNKEDDVDVTIIISKIFVIHHFEMIRIYECKI